MSDVPISCTSVFSQTALDDVFLVVGQEATGSWRVWQDPVDRGADRDCGDAFQYEAGVAVSVMSVVSDWQMRTSTSSLHSQLCRPYAGWHKLERQRKLQPVQQR